MSFWSNVTRLLDRLLGEPAPLDAGLDPSKVERAIRIIQSHVDAERRERNIALLRVSDLSPETQARLADELARVLEDEAEAGQDGTTTRIERPEREDGRLAG